jgi:CHASE2 domain-containing sensor protein
MQKPGWKTTEFAVTVLTALAALIAALAGQLSPRYAAIAAAVSVGLYAVSRGLAKVPTPVIPPAPPTP